MIATRTFLQHRKRRKLLKLLFGIVNFIQKKLCKKIYPQIPYILAYKSINFGQNLNLLFTIRLIHGSWKMSIFCSNFCLLQFLQSLFIPPPRFFIQWVFLEKETVPWPILSSFVPPLRASNEGAFCYCFILP